MKSATNTPSPSQLVRLLDLEYERRRQRVDRPPSFDPPPQVTAVLARGGRTVVVRCPFCRRTHVHGVPDASSYGPRLSHCHNVEPRTYVLVPAQ